jgi:hypothetical protein
MLCYAFALVDFAGMFLRYDLTGVSWSPIAAGVLGSALSGLASRINRTRAQPSPALILTCLVLISLAAIGAGIHFAGQGDLTFTRAALEREIQESIRRKWAEDKNLAQVSIDRVSLTNQAGKRFQGWVAVTYEDERQTLPLVVTRDGESTTWEISLAGLQDPSRRKATPSAAGGQGSARPTEAIAAFRMDGCAIGMTFPTLRARFPQMTINSKESRPAAGVAVWEVTRGLEESGMARFRFHKGELYSMAFINISPGETDLLNTEAYTKLEGLFGEPQQAEARSCRWVFDGQDRRVRLVKTKVDEGTATLTIIDKPSTVILTGGASD